MTNWMYVLSWQLENMIVTDGKFLLVWKRELIVYYGIIER